jgi:hypothetical protein
MLSACGNCCDALTLRKCPMTLSVSAWRRKLRRRCISHSMVISLERVCKYQGGCVGGHQLALPQSLKCRQCALHKTLTVSFALFGHVHNVLREGVPGTLGITINPKGGFVSLDHLLSIVQRAAENGNGIGVV